MDAEQEAKLAAVRARWGLRPIQHLWNHTNHTYLCECLDPGGRHLGRDGGSYHCQDCPCEDYRETVCAQCGKTPGQARKRPLRNRKAPPVRGGERRGALPESYHPLLSNQERQELTTLLDRDG